MNHSSSNSLKSKIFALFFAIAALSAYAGDGNMNFYGQLGVHKTQSAQTLGHGRFGFGMFLEGALLKNIIGEQPHKDGNVGNQEFCSAYNANGACIYPYSISSDYIGGNGYLSFSFGLSDYFDIALDLPPGYGEYLEIENELGDKQIWAVGWGDLFISTKIRAPFKENLPLDVSLLLGFGASTSKTDNGKLHAYGPWVRDPMFLNIKNEHPIAAGEDKASTYSNANTFLKVGLAATFDFNRIKAEIPILFHVNGTYRTTLGTEGNYYSNVPSISTALEWTPIRFLSLFGEWYKDIPLKWPNDGKSIDLSTMSLGTSFHLSKTVDLQVAVQKFIGDRKFVDNLTVNLSDSTRASYNTRLIPNYVIFGGLTVKFFAIEPRNPDTDGDGVCDPWVAESGRQNDYLRVCKDIDLCPYEKGSPENKGCSKQSDAPAIMFTALPDVVQKGQSVTLAWQVTNATKVNIEGIGDLGDLPPSGSRKVKPTENTIFKLTAVGDGGTQTATADVEVSTGPLPVILFSANPETVQVGNHVTLSWQVNNATEVSIEGIGRVQLKGTKQVKPTENTVFKLTAVGEGGTLTESVAVDVTTAPIIEARVNLTGVSFGSGNAVLTANAKKILDGVAEQLLANPKVKIEIQGHTDNVGKPATNKLLSERRAKSVVAYLAMKGVKMDRMTAVGYGQELPIADNNTADGRELNRRIEMVRIDN